MKITLNLESLQTALKLIQKAIPSNPQLPILSSIHLKLEKSQLTLSATDLYLGIKASIPTESTESVEVAIPGETFRDFINSFSGDEIIMDVQTAQITLTSGQSQVKIPIQKTKDYPDFPEINGDSIPLSTSFLEEVKNLVSFAASIDQARPVLTAILLNFTDSGLEVVGTDGFRLALLNYPDIIQQPRQLLIPVKAFNEVCRIAIQTKAEFVDLQVSTELKQLKFNLANNEVFVRLIEGDYPPYQKIIPDGFTSKISLDGETLKKELQRAFVLARESSNIVKLSLESDSLTINSISPAYGEYQGKILLPTENKELNEIAFNTTYLLDFLNSVKPGTLFFEMNESLKPAMFTIDGRLNFKYMVMPFRVNE